MDLKQVTPSAPQHGSVPDSTSTVGHIATDIGAAAIVGSALGAAAGSILPGLGTAAGALVGAVIGVGSAVAAIL